MQGNSLMPRLKEEYKKKIIPSFLKDPRFKNIFQVPRIEKIVINTSIGKNIENSKLLPRAADILANISGQKAIITKAKKSIAAFKLREGMPIGAKITLRNNIMYEFFDRLISVALPRVRDFRGLSDKAFDGKGNYTLGIKEITIFPEAVSEESNFGLEISIVISTKNDKDAKKLLEEFGFPFKKSSK